MSEPLPFLAISLVVALAFYAFRSPAWRRAVTIAANLGFLATFFTGIRSAAPFVAFLLGSYAGLRLIQWRRKAFVTVLAATLIAFVWLKRYAFVPSGALLPFTYATVGLSYILFRVIHLMIDFHSGEEREVSLISFFNYTCGFTTLVSGPIQGYREWLTTADPAVRAPFSALRAAESMERMLRGVFKTNVLALVLSALQSRMLDAAMNLGSTADARILPGALALVLYLLFLYCNFSGYIDIAIGAANLLGASLPENFNRPFSAESVLDYWNARWHITLSHWLRSYVYNPLMVSLMRRFPSRALELPFAVLAFFTTFLLIGVWHGQTGEFVFYGLILGFGVSVNKIFQVVLVRRLGRKRSAALSGSPVFVTLARGLTFTWNTFTLVWFWADWHTIRALANALAPRMPIVWILIFASATVILAAWESVFRETRSALREAPIVWSWCLRTALAVGAVVATAATTALINRPAPDIVYKAF